MYLQLDVCRRIYTSRQTTETISEEAYVEVVHLCVYTCIYTYMCTCTLALLVNLVLAETHPAHWIG